MRTTTNGVAVARWQPLFLSAVFLCEGAREILGQSGDVPHAGKDNKAQGGGDKAPRAPLLQRKELYVGQVEREEDGASRRGEDGKRKRGRDKKRRHRIKERITHGNSSVVRHAEVFQGDAPNARIGAVHYRVAIKADRADERLLCLLFSRNVPRDEEPRACCGNNDEVGESAHSI